MFNQIKNCIKASKEIDSLLKNLKEETEKTISSVKSNGVILDKTFKVRDRFQGEVP